MESTDKTYCKYEYTIDFKDIVPLPQKETPIPAIVASWDIEASSSHGDFPVAIKSYRKLIGEIITYWTIHDKDSINTSFPNFLKLTKKLGATFH